MNLLRIRKARASSEKPSVKAAPTFNTNIYAADHLDEFFLPPWRFIKK
jgi:hypothetical protein